MIDIPDSHRDLLNDETKAYAYLATLMPDGSPQVTPVWFNTDGEHILINTARGRVKEANLRARPMYALLVADPQDPLRYVQLRGTVIGHSEQSALEHIGSLSMKYRGRSWASVDGQVRVIFTLAVHHVSVS